MLNKLKALFEGSEFFRNAFKLTSATVVAQFLPILIAPILTRIYTPEQFATYGLFFALMGVIGVAVTGKYEFAIMLPEKEEDAINIAAVGVLLTIAFGIVTLLAVVLLHKQIVLLLGNPDIGFWLYFVPLGIVLTGFYNVFNFLQNRNRQYGLLSASRIYRAILTSGINIVSGFIRSGWWAAEAAGLIVGTLAGQVMEIIMLRKIDRGPKSWMQMIDAARMKVMAKKYIDFPKYDVSSELMVTASVQLPVLMFNRYFAQATTGLYFHAHRVLSLPMSMLGSSIGQVLLRQLADKRNDMPALSAMVRKTYSTLLLMGAVAFGTTAAFGEELFAFVFGNEWREAGTFAEQISPWLLFNFVGSPLTMIFPALEKQGQMFLWILTIFIARVISMIVGLYICNNVYDTVVLFSASGTVCYFFMNMYLVCGLSKVSVKNFLKDTFGLPLLIVVGLFLVKFVVGFL